MRIGLTSDIHTDFSPANRKVVSHLVDLAGNAELDVFIICGDISPDSMTFSRTLLAFHNIDDRCKKLFVAGNHDIWVINGNINITSHDKYLLITRLCKECGFHHLGDKPIVINNIGFCGNIGWYDYSYKSDKFNIPEKDYISKTYGTSVWNDVNYAKWNADDYQMARYFATNLKEQIDSIKDISSKIIIATHHVPFRECVRYRDELPWDFFSAFMGSSSLGEICLNEPLVEYVLFGHTHIEFYKKIKAVWAVCSPIGYLIDPPKDLRKYAQERLCIIEV